MKILPPAHQTSYLPVPAQAGTVIFKPRKFQLEHAMSDPQQLKRQVGVAALAFLEQDMILGVGTGSTVNAMLEQLHDWAPRLKGAVSSSEASTRKLESLGIPVLDLNTVNCLGVYIDGADESNARLELIKGGGA